MKLVDEKLSSLNEQAFEKAAAFYGSDLARYVLNLPGAVFLDEAQSSSYLNSSFSELI